MFKDRIMYIDGMFSGTSKLCINTKHIQTMKDSETLYDFYCRVYNISSADIETYEEERESKGNPYRIRIGVITKENEDKAISAINNHYDLTLTIDFYNTDNDILIDIVKRLDEPETFLSYVPYNYQFTDLVKTVYESDPSGTAIKFIDETRLKDIRQWVHCSEEEVLVLSSDIAQLLLGDVYCSQEAIMDHDVFKYVSALSIMNMVIQNKFDNRFISEYNISDYAYNKLIHYAWKNVPHTKANLSVLRGLCKNKVCEKFLKRESRNLNLVRYNEFEEVTSEDPTFILYLRPIFQTNEVCWAALNGVVKNNGDKYLMSKIIANIDHPTKGMINFAIKNGASLDAVMESYEGEFDIDTVITAMESDKSNILALRGSELR